jgi:predicted transcriptional regulator
LQIYINYNKVVIRLRIFLSVFCKVHKVRNIEVMSRFGKNVRKIRIEREMTQEQLSEEAMISQVQVARIESGKLNTSISTVCAIAYALKVEVGDLFQ